MAKPNRTVAAFRRKHPFAIGISERIQNEQKEPFWVWFFSDKDRAAKFKNIDEAREAFERTRTDKERSNPGDNEP